MVRQHGPSDAWLVLHYGTSARSELDAPPFGSRPKGGVLTRLASNVRRRLSYARVALLAIGVASAGCADDAAPVNASGMAGSSAGATAAVGGAGGGSGMNLSPPPAGSSAAGSGSAAPGAGGKLSFATDVYEGVIRKRCGNCHNDAPSFGGLAFFPGGAAAAYANLVGVPAGAEDGYQCRASKLVRVQPGDPEVSLIYLKLTNPPCGSRMPPAAFGVATAQEVELVRTWIAGGAAP